MSRTTRTAVVIAFSLLVASGASLLVLRQVQQLPAREVEVKSYQVAVAAKDLAVGSQLTAGDVKLVAWPASNPIAGAFSTTDEVVGRGLMATVVANEPLTAAKVASREAGAGLSPIITPGMRAISVKVDEVVGVAGFVVPGARVDVVVTINQREQSVARVVVGNVQVLAAGTKVDQQPARDARPQPATVVTLLVNPEDAERISLAASVGRITLTMRNPLDVAQPDTAGTRVASLMGTPEEPPPPPPVARAPRPRQAEAAPVAVVAPPSVYTVETIRDAKRTAEVVR